MTKTRGQSMSETKADHKAITSAPKNTRSDRMERRARADLSNPDSIPYNLRGAIPGQVDRGHAHSPFEVITRSNQTGEILRTRHADHRRAAKAAVGRAGHHTLVRIMDHGPAKDLTTQEAIGHLIEVIEEVAEQAA